VHFSLEIICCVLLSRILDDNIMYNAFRSAYLTSCTRIAFKSSMYNTSTSHIFNRYMAHTYDKRFEKPRTIKITEYRERIIL